MYINLAECIDRIGNPVNSILHIGAHHGEEGPDYAANGVKRVVWIEANKNVMSGLLQNTSMLNMKQEYILACLSDIDGEKVSFNVASNGQSSSLLELGTHAKMYPHITYTDTIEMTARRFDKLILEYGDLIDVGEFDFINLDVQGAELKVLKGFGDLLDRPNFRAIYTEVNLEHVYEDCCLIEDLDEYLIKFGFRRDLTRCPEGSWGDALYIR